MKLAAAAASKVAPGFLDRFQPSIYDIPTDVDIEAHELILKAVEASLSKITKFLEVNINHQLLLHMKQCTWYFVKCWVMFSRD